MCVHVKPKIRINGFDVMILKLPLSSFPFFVFFFPFPSLPPSLSPSLLLDCQDEMLQLQTSTLLILVVVFLFSLSVMPYQMTL